MSSMFIDNETLLNAETFNKFEEEIRSIGLPIFNAAYDDSDSAWVYYYIDDEKFERELKVGYTFIMIPNTSSKGTSGKLLFIGHNGYGDPLYWNDMDVNPQIADYNAYAKVNDTKYLVGGVPYIIKCFGKVGNNFQFIIMEMFQQPKLPVANQTNFGGIKVWVSGTTLNISTK